MVYDERGVFSDRILSLGVEGVLTALGFVVDCLGTDKTSEQRNFENPCFPNYVNKSTFFVL